MPPAMIDDSHYVARTELEMIGQFGAGAAHIARALAEASDEVQDDMLTSAETWHDIADAIERAFTKNTATPYAYDSTKPKLPSAKLSGPPV
jgi:hypothetical protein